MVNRPGLLVYPSPEWMEKGRQRGLAYHANAMVQGYEREYRDDPRLSKAEHVRGAHGEISVAIIVGQVWNVNMRAFKHEPDVGDRIDVRTTSCRTGHLKLALDDKPERLHVLVIEIEVGCYRIAGAIEGVDGMVDRWRRTEWNGKPCQPYYWIPQSALGFDALARECRR